MFVRGERVRFAFFEVTTECFSENLIYFNQRLDY